MKKNYVSILTVLTIMFCGTFMIHAQQKNFINYQGVARNSDNELMEQETMEIGIALKFGTLDAAAQYQESHSVTTDANGVFNLQIGSGTSNSGSYANLPWGDAAFVSVSFNGAEVGTTELMAVPFAMASGDNVWKANGNDIENKNVGEVKVKSDFRILGGFNLSTGNQVNEISDDGELVENSNGILPTQRAVKTYVDNRLFSGGGGGDAQIASEVPYNNADSGLAAVNVQEALDELVGASGGGDDADADPTNEIQDISLSGTDLSITDGSTIDLSAIIPLGGTDDQNASEVSFDNTGTGLAAGDTQAAIEELAAGGLVDTDDQNLSLSGTMLQITDGTGVDLATIIPLGGTDDQNASEVPFDNTGTGLAAVDTQAAIEELATGGLVDTDDQNLSLSGTMLQITDGTGVDLAAIIPPGGTDDQEASEVPFDNTGTGLTAVDTQAAIEELAAGGLVDTDDQGLVLTGDVLSIEDGVGSVDLSDYFNRTTNHGLLVGDDGIVDGLIGTSDGQVAKWDNALGNWVAGTDEVGGGSSLWSENGSNIHFNGGNVGIGTETPSSPLEIVSNNDSPILVESTRGDGNGWIRFNKPDGRIGYVGMYGANGEKDIEMGTAGDNTTGNLHLTIGGEPKFTLASNGNVGIGTKTPSSSLEIVSNNDSPILIESTRGDGNGWIRFNKPDGRIGYVGMYGANGVKDIEMGTTGDNTTGKLNLTMGGAPKLTVVPNGSVGIGIRNPEGALHVLNNSTLTKPLLKLEEEGNDFARLELTNDASEGAFWHVAGFPSSTAASAKLNFYFRNASGGGDRMTITGNGQVGVNTSNPSARLTINQASQQVGTGLSFRDGTANKDWHITHGFALRFHYGTELRGFINANTGAYTAASDERLKSEIKVLPDVLERISLLRPSSYIFKADKSKTRAIGFVAQQVQPLFPELVSESGDDDILGVNYGGFSVVAIRAIQEQQEIITEQSRIISKLEERLQRLEAIIAK